MTEQKTEALTAHNQLVFQPGEMFGQRYQIIEEIGVGGMGRVFKARDLELDEAIALKMIKPELSANTSIVARFKRELKLAREINHDNVIRIHDLGEVDGIKYISMKFIDGQTLDDIIGSTGKLTIEKAIDTTRQICLALAEAHKKGIIHRDLKSKNIMLDKSGRVFVLDFGIAKSFAGSGDTETGIALGTPDFMSPEQMEGEKIDSRSDIYSLGIVIYQMVTGRLPFSAANRTAMLLKRLNETVEPASKWNPGLPEWFEQMIEKCMKKKAEDRYNSIEELLAELESAHPETEPRLRESPASSKHRWFARKISAVKRAFKSRKLFYSLGLSLVILLVMVTVYVSHTSNINVAIGNIKWRLSLLVHPAVRASLNQYQEEAENFFTNKYPVSRNYSIAMDRGGDVIKKYMDLITEFNAKNKTIFRGTRTPTAAGKERLAAYVANHRSLADKYVEAIRSKHLVLSADTFSCDQSYLGGYIHLIQFLRNHVLYYLLTGNTEKALEWQRYYLITLIDLHHLHSGLSSGFDLHLVYISLISCDHARYREKIKHIRILLETLYPLGREAFHYWFLSLAVDRLIARDDPISLNMYGLPAHFRSPVDLQKVMEILRQGLSGYGDDLFKVLRNYKNQLTRKLKSTDPEFRQAFAGEILQRIYRFYRLRAQINILLTLIHYRENNGIAENFRKTRYFLDPFYTDSLPGRPGDKYSSRYLAVGTSYSGNTVIYSAGSNLVKNNFTGDDIGVEIIKSTSIEVILKRFFEVSQQKFVSDRLPLDSKWRVDFRR